MTVAPGDLIAVTGGTGAIGRRLVADLIPQGYRIRLLSRSTPEDRAVEHATVDFAADEPLDPEILRGCAAVVHLASHIPANQEDAESADQCFRTNALGTLKLLQASEEAGISHFLQTTSANAYAPGLQSPREDDPMYPSARAPFYLSSKLVQDAWGAYWSNRRGLPVTTLRLSSVYGAGMEAALFTRFAKALHKGDCITIANGGIFGADFVEISDVSAAVTLFLGNGATGPFNIASGERTSLAEAARLLSELSGRGAAGLIVESEHQAEAGFPAMDISKARRLGFSPTGLRAGLEKLVAWVAKDGGEASD